MEPLLHLVIPLVALLLFGVGLKKALALSLLAIIPDLDALFHVHRSFSHSLPIVLAAFAVATPAFRRFKAGKFAILAILVVSSHLFFDLFSGYTPIFWPIYNNSISIIIELAVHIGSDTSLSFDYRILTKPVSFDQFDNMSTYLLTGDGLLISAVLVAATAFSYVKLRSSKASK